MSALSLRSERHALLARADLTGDAFCRAYSDAADRWLAELFDRVCGDSHRDVGLMAVGGYGRGELCPYSDLDLVLLHSGRRDINNVADAIWYPVWDEGVRLDHSVRRPDEVLTVAKADLRAQLGLLNARCVAGDQGIIERLAADALSLWKHQAGHWLPVLARQVTERQAAHGDVAFLLEPDLKESHGGLRDVTVLEAATKALGSSGEAMDLGSLSSARSTLTAARVELHRISDRASDRLLLQEQDQVASRLLYQDADALMADVATAGRTIAVVGDEAWRRPSMWSMLPGHRGRRWNLFRRGGAGGDHVTGGNLTCQVAEEGVSVAVDQALVDNPQFPQFGEVVLDQDIDPSTDPIWALRIAAVAAERSLPIARSTLDRLQLSPAPIPEPWPDELRGELVRILGTGEPAIAALEAVDQRGLLVHYIPEWAGCRNKPQRNAYHRFTVDRHLLEAASRAASLALGVRRPDLLLVGTLLHDIGKGYPGDHTEIGMELVAHIGPRLGFSQEDTDTLVRMVQLHLLLPDVATRRDLDDPATVENVARQVGDRTTLELLDALTKADSQATGPAAWGQWKAGLVADLVSRVDARLAGTEEPALPRSFVTERHRDLMRHVGQTGRSVVAAEDNGRVTVVAGDRVGLLAVVTGILALSGLDVRSANVASEGDYAIEVFSVEPTHQRWPEWDKVASDLELALRGGLDISALLEKRKTAYGDQRRIRSARPVQTRVVLDNHASDTATVLEVHARDGVGLLHRITTALSKAALDVVSARVSTLGDEVLDSFYVKDDTTGRKITDPARLQMIEDSVVAALTTPRPPSQPAAGDGDVSTADLEPERTRR